MSSFKQKLLVEVNKLASDIYTKNKDSLRESIVEFTSNIDQEIAGLDDYADTYLVELAKKPYTGAIVLLYSFAVLACGIGVGMMI